MVVHGLPYEMDWRGLKDLMREAGAVTRADVKSDASGRSKGYGIVAFETPADAQHAIEAFNGRVLPAHEISHCALLHLLLLSLQVLRAGRTSVMWVLRNSWP